MLIIFNVQPPIGDNIGNVILQLWLRVGIQELFIVSTQSPLLLPMVSLMVSLGMFSPLLLIFFHLFGFIITYALTHISFAIATIIPNYPGKVFLFTVVTSNKVVLPHFGYRVACP